MYSIDQPLTLGRPLRSGLQQTTGEPTDSAVIERSLTDPQAFALIFDRHWRALHAYCTSRAAAAGEDIAAEVFRRAFDHRKRYDRGLEDARPWLYGIATNLLRHHFRSSKRKDRADRRALAFAELETTAQPLEQLEAQSLGPQLTHALQALPVADREALLLFAWAELSYQEIALALDVPLGTVRSRLHRARARVREQVVLNSQEEQMSDQMELDWLVQERPQPLPLDPATTSSVRAEMLGRRDSGARPGAPRRSGPRAWVWRGLAGGVTLGGSAAAVLAVIGVGGQGGATVLAARPPATRAHHVIVSASARRLTHLSVRLADEPVASGDATLVLRRQVYPNSPEIDGADLYADNGNYYYAPTLSGLPAAIQQNETVNLGSSDSEKRDIAAAEAALTEPIDQASQRMSVANLDPNVKPTVVTPGSGTKAQQAVQQKMQAAEQQAKQDNVQAVISQQDGMIWDNGMDALTAGAGNPQVRAGVLKLFATIPQITTSNGTLNGQPTLDITASLLSSNQGLYQEQLILNANTGLLLEMIGGNQGQTPSVTVYYTVTRTTVADVENGSAG